MSDRIEDLTPIELAWLASEYRSREPGPCRVCGEELGIASAGGGRATVYRCNSDAAQWLIGASKKTPEEKAEAKRHWDESIVEIASHGDSRVRALIAEVRRRRQLAGEDAYPVVGEMYDPTPYEGSVPYQRYLGDDRFEFTEMGAELRYQKGAPEVTA